MKALVRAAAIGVLFLTVAGFAPAPQSAAATTTAPAASPPVAPVAAGAVAVHPLTAADVGAWLDGFMPDAIHRADIAGAVVVVVKDGQTLFQSGYGLADVKAHKPVDADTTLFRPGSVSKLFTWTAVMQQVETGKIDLDADINRYLDFKIPPYQGKPITMRHLMTHSSGFSDAAKDLMSRDPKVMKSTETLLKAAIPPRIFPSGQVPAYSNYGAALAGYIVQRLSGEPFDQYVARHIFTPLGMAHSSFAQPLPASLQPQMAKGYRVASGAPGPFELVQSAPAGALSATGSDMGRFMIAHLQGGEFQGQRILAAPTAQLMHTPQFRPTPGLDAMALGFYTEPGNGRRVIGHAGDTNFFHSDLHLYLDDGVGLFVSFNSAGNAGAAHNIRASLFKEFTDRYIAPQPAQEPTWKDAKADGQTLPGYYVNSRRADSGWLRMASFLLGQARITSDKDGIVTVSAYRGLNSKPKQWREVGPFQYREVGGNSRMAAVVKDGRVMSVMTSDLPPVMAFQPVSPSMSASWNKPLLYVALGLFTIGALTWPLAAIIRWRYGHRFQLTGRPALLYRLTRLACVLNLAVAGLWVAFLSYAESDLQAATSSSDWMIRIIQVVGVLAILGAVAGLANAATVLRDGSRSWFAKVSSVLLAAALLAGVWFQLSLHLITPHVVY